MNKQVKQNYEKACNDYLRLFCDKHELEYDPTCWIGDIGNWAQIADFVVTIDTMRIDIDNNIPEEEFFKWYEYDMRVRMIECERGYINFKSWSKGAPRLSEEELVEFESRWKWIKELEDDFKKQVQTGNTF